MTPFSRWEKELPKLITDSRWTAIGSLKERRLLFDDFCKTSADEHKRAKADRARKAREDFQALLDGAESAAPPGKLGIGTRGTCVCGLDSTFVETACMQVCMVCIPRPGMQ